MGDSIEHYGGVAEIKILQQENAILQITKKRLITCISIPFLLAVLFMILWIMSFTGKNELQEKYD